MADDNKLWFEMGVRDKVTEHITEIITQAALVQREMDAITASERAAYQNAAKLEQVYDKIAIAMQRIGDARSLTNDNNKLRKLNDMEAALKRMKAAFEEIENNETKMGLKGTVALEQLKQGFQLMTTQVARYANEIENTSKKESRAHDDEIRRQDKLKSKLYELQNLRKRLSDSILQAPDGYDTSAASRLTGQLWSKEMQVRRYMRNGREVPLDFFGADYAEMKRQAEEYGRTISKAHREASAAVQQNARANQQLVSTYDQVIEKSKGTNSVLRQMEIQLASTFSLYGAEHLLKSVIQIGGEFEQQHIALQNILGDVEEANTLFNQIQTLAVVSPFNFRQLTSYAKQTAAYGVPYEELYDTTKRLADLSAGLGVDMGRLILAYGQVRSASVLRGQELRQFTEAGIPLVQKLADKFTELNGRVVTTGEVFEFISKRKVPFEMVKEILWDMTSAGGSFYQMQFKLSDTLLGKWSNLQDAWEIMLSKFAEGGSTGGDTLKWLVQGATDLIESLDRLSPVLTGVIGGIGLSKLTKLATGNILNTEKAILDAKKLEASRLRRDALTRSLSEREQEILNTSNKITVNDIKALASAGRLNTLKLQQLYVSKQLTQADVARLVNEKAITVEQGAQITNATRLRVVLGSLRATVGNIASGFMSMLTSPAFLMTAGISAALSLYATWKDAENERKEIAESVGNAILDQYNQVLKVQQDISKSNPSTDGEYLKGINEMTETLKSIGAYSGDIDSQARSIENLGDRYAYLKKKIDEAAVAYQNLARHAQTSTEYAISQTDGWFDESIVTNMKDLTDTLDDFDKAAIGIQRYGSIIQAEIDKFDSFAGNESLRKQLDGKSIEEQLKIIAESGHWQSIQNMVGQTSAKAREALEDFNEAYFDVLSDWNTITGEDLPAFIQGIEDAFKREHPDIDLTNLDDEMKLELKRFVHQALTEVDGVRQDIKDRLEQDIDAHFKINVDFELSISTPPDYWRVKYPVLNQLLGKLGEKGLNYDNSFYNSIGEAGGATSSDKLWKYMDSQVDDLKKKWEAEEKLYGTASEQAIKAKNSYEDMQKARDAAFGGSLKDAMKSGSKGSQKDTDLEAIKNRVDLYKKFYSELENAKKIFGPNGGLAFLKQNGFGSVFGWGLSDLTDYSKSLNELTQNLLGTTEARRKFLDQTDSDSVSQKRKREAESMKDYVSELQRMMSVMSENYQTYKKWIDLTGDSELASRIAGVAQNTSYSDYLREAMKKELDKTNLALTPDDVFGLDQAGIKNLGENSAFHALWEDWRKNQQLLKKEQLDLYEEAIKNAKDYDDKIADINRDLEKQIAAIEALGGDSRLIENARQNAQDKTSELLWEKFKKENDWGRVFGDLDNLSLDTIKDMVNAMKKFQKETRLSEKETRAWQKAMKELTDKKIMLDPINSLTDAIKKFNAAVKAENQARQEKDLADQKVTQIRSQIATNPQAASDKQKRLNDAIEEQTKAKKKLTKAEDETREAFTELKKAATAIASSIKNLGSSLSSLGSSVGGDFGNILGGFGTMFSQLGNGIEQIKNLDLNAKGLTGVMNNVSAVLTVVTTMVEMNKALASILPSTESIYQKRAEEQKKINQLRAAIDAYRVSVARARAEENGWISDDPLRGLQNAYKIHGEIASQYYNKLYEAQEAYVESAAGIKSALVPILAAITAIVAVIAGVFTFGTGAAAVGALGASAIGALTAGTVALTGAAAVAAGAAIAAGVGYAVGQVIQAGIDAITYENGQVDARSNMKVQTRHRTFFRSEKTQNLEEWTKENLGLDLFDKSGLIDLKVAQAVLDSGITLVGETKETLEKLMELREQYDEWEKSIKDYISSSFGGLADNLTNAVWDWLDGGKDALDSFYDYASDTFKKIAQDAVKTFLKTAVLDKFEEQLEALYKAYSMQDQHGNRVIDEQQLMLGVASIAGDMAIAFEQILPVAQSLAQTIANAFEFQGYDIVNGSQGSNTSMSSGIKSISEGTADLLASYLNAIRADVSVNRDMMASYYPQFLSVMMQNNTIANAQLEQMRDIVQNTRKNVEFVEMIYNILHGVAPDGTKIHVK